MSYTKVDYNKFEHAADAIDTYVSRHETNMRKIDTEINELSISWQGTDYLSLKKEWNQINASDSSSGQMIKSLKNYANFLRFAANKYKSAQANAINIANRLP